MIQQSDKIDWDKAAKATAPSGQSSGIDWGKAAAATAPDPSFLAKARAFAASVGGAAYQSTGQAMEFTGRNLGLEGLESSGQALTQRGTENLQAAETVNPGGFGNEVGEIVGSGLPMAVAGMATGGASLMAGAGVRAAAAMGSAAVSLFGGAQNAQAGREEALAYGRPDQAGKSEVLSFLIGLSEGLPVWGVIGKAVKAGGMNPDKIAGLLIRAIVENAAQEGGQQLLENPKAKMLYDERRAFTQGVLEATKRGAIGGAIFGGAGVAGGKAAEALSGGSGDQDRTSEPQPRGVQPEPSQEPAAAPAKREPLEAVSPETETGIKAFSEQVGSKLRAVKPATPEDTFLSEFGQQRGTRVSFVEAEDGKPMRLPAMYREGEILLDANAPEGIKRRLTLLHELLHGLKDRKGETWFTLLEDVQTLDGPGLQQANETYRTDYKLATGKDLPDALTEEEGLSRYAETLGVWLEKMLTEPERLARALDKSRTFRERLRDTIARILEAVGVRFDSVQQQRLKELVRDLGKPPTGNAQQSLELAHKFAQAINSMSGIELVPRTESPQPQRATKSAEVQGTATASTEAGQAAATTQPVFDRVPSDSDIEARYAKVAGGKSDGRIVRSEVPNTESIESSLTEWDELPGIRDVPIGDFNLTGRHYSVSGQRRIDDLAEQIRQSGEVNPLIVVIDKSGPYILEGATRAEALFRLGAKSFPAVIVKDTESLDTARAAATTPPVAEPTQAATPVVESQEAVAEPQPKKLRRKKKPDRFAVAPKADSPEFKRWFGDSKVVDESGKPLVVYHGTRAHQVTTFKPSRGGEYGSGIYFTDDPGSAHGYAERSERAGNPNIIPVYIRLENPYLAESRDEVRALGPTKLKARGYDGIIAAKTGGYDRQYVVFDTEQIKSASGNIGTFDRANPDIRFAVSPHVGPNGPINTFKVPETTQDLITRKGINYLNRGERLARVTGVKAEWINTLKALPLKVGSALREFNNRTGKPIRAALEKFGIEPWEAGRYVYALHAPDRNKLVMDREEAEIAKSELDEQQKARKARKWGLESNPGSGMSNSEAAKIIKEVNADAKRLEGFRIVARIMREVNKEKLAVMVKSGRLSAEGAAEWARLLGPNYVSLKESAVVPYFDREGSQGAQTDPKGKRIKGRFSQRDFSRIISETLGAAEREILNAEHNEVGKEFGNWVREVNNPAIASFSTYKRKDAEGILEDVALPPAVKPGEDVYTYYEGGHPAYIVIRDSAKDNAGRPLLSRAIKGVGIADGGEIFRAARSVMSIVRHTRSSWNPEFAVSNPQSDIGGAIITIQKEGGKKLGRSILKGIAPAAQAMWHREHGTGKRVAWSDWADKFAAHGGQMGLMDVRTPEEIMKSLSASFDPNPFKKGVRGVLDSIDAVNSTLENMTRLSVFVTMHKELTARGYTDEKASKEAARLAREITTPFNEKGEWSSGMGLLSLFFNARVQGAKVLINAIKNPRVQRSLAAIMASTFMLTLLNRAIMGKDDEGEDEWDKIDKLEKYNNIIMVVPGTKKVLKVRAPRMYQWLHIAAVGLAEMLEGDLSASQYGADIFTAVVDGLSPLDTSASLGQALTPTILQPAYQIATNEGPFGRQVNPEYPNDMRPPSEQAFKQASPTVRAIVRAINEVTGGDEVTPGRVSLRPGSVANVLDFLGGGTGTFGGRVFGLVEKAVGGQEILPNDVPLLRKAIAGQNPRFESNRFYESTKAVEELEYRVKAYRERGDAEKAKDAIMADHATWKLRVAAKASSKRVKDLRAKLDAAPKGSDRYKELEAAIEAVMARFNDLARRTK